jgi:hypothetical protein
MVLDPAAAEGRREAVNEVGGDIAAPVAISLSPLWAEARSVIGLAGVACSEGLAVGAVAADAGLSAGRVTLP